MKTHRRGYREATVEKKLKFGSAESMEGAKHAESVKKAEQKRHFYNRFFQKKRYKDAYRAARAGKSAGSLGGATTIAGVENMTVKAKIALKEIVKRSRAMFAGIGIFALLFLVIAVSLGSCSASRVADIWLKTNLKAHYFISNQYWKSNYELVKEMMLQSEVYVFEVDKMIQGFVGLNDEYIEGIFISDEMQSCGIGKLLLDYIKDKKERLQLNVYQKNARAISFYQREGFIIEGEGLDEATGEKEYTMLWKQNRNRNFYKELIQKAGAETELVYMKASKELLKKRLYKRNQVLNANSPFVITDEILEHHYHAFQEPWGEGGKVILQKGDIMQYSKEESKAIWNQNAEFWDCAMGDESNDFHREVVRPKVTELLNPDSTDYILDIACGNGNYSAYLAEKALSVLAFDYSEKMVELAKKRQKRYADHIEFCVADATNETSLMALKRNKPFTKAVSNMAVMDITDIKPLFTSVYKLLEDNGVFVFATQHPCFVTLTEKYMTPHSYYDIAIEGQPQKQCYYHRSLQDIFNLCFDTGFVIDGFYEECYFNKEIPDIIIVRAIKIER